jgi:hypothetical protein
LVSATAGVSGKAGERCLLVTAIAFSVPSLRAANVGMAIGRDGDAAAREVADVFRQDRGLRRVLINSVHVHFAPKATEILRCREMTRCANTGSASCKTLVVGKGDMHHQLAFRRVTGNVSFA